MEEESGSGGAGSVLEGEIRAQPAALERFRVAQGEATLALGAALGRTRPAGVLIAARGSSDHAAVCAKYLFGVRLGVPVALAAPSLFTVYGREPRLAGWVVLGISQSGASPDVVAVIAAARRQGCATLALTDATDSDLARAAEHVVPLCVDGERSVAATGSFTCTLYALAHLVAGWQGADAQALPGVPDRVARTLDGAHATNEIADALAAHDMCVVLGRGYAFPAALEWSLKLKEVAGLFAEPFSAADYRHGPIALASTGLPVVMIDPDGPARADLHTLAEDLGSRGARVIRVADDEAAALRFEPGPEWLAPIPATVLGQLVALRTAPRRGHDPDNPSGLQKVTRTL